MTTRFPLRASLLRLLGILFVVGLIAAACGSDDNETTTAAEPTEEPAAEPAAEPAEEPAAEPAAEPAEEPADENAEWNAIVEAATAEGKVTIYSSQHPDRLEEMAQAFEAKYPGIDVEIFRAIDGDLIQKVTAEEETGNVSADVLVIASQVVVDQHNDSGWIVEPLGANFDNPDYNRDLRIPRGTYWEASAAVLTFGWNTDLLPEGISDYPDFLNPELDDGRIGVINPSVASIVDFWVWLEEQYGEEFVTQLAELNPRIYPSSLPMGEALASGEISAGTFVTVQRQAKEDGAPVDSGIAPGGAWGAHFWGEILSFAPHPNAAQLLADFIVTWEAQTFIAADAGSVVPTDTSVIDSAKVRFQDNSLLTEEFVAAYMEKWQELYE